MTWIVAVTKPNQEAIASRNLERQGFVHYCPKISVSRLSKEPIIRPLFPRYMFIWIDQFWYSIRSTWGISNVLMNEAGPQPIAEQIITELKSREKEGLVQLTPAPKFLPGSKVKTEEGWLAGQPLIYDGMAPHERCWVLANLLGQQAKVLLEERLLLAA